MKIIFGCLNHEANSFAEDEGSWDRWARTNGATFGNDIFDAFRGKHGAHLSGMIDAGEEEGVELIPTVSLAGAAPVLTREALDYGVDIICDVIKKNPDADGLCFCLHGAGIAEGVDDVESYTMRRMREAAGRHIPIAMSCDLHANVTDDMLKEADAGVFGMKMYPHIDKYETGYLAMKTLIGKLRGEVEPVTAYRPIPMLISCCNACTLEPPMKPFTDHMAEYCKEHDLIDVTFFNGFPYCDVPFSRCSVVVVGRKGQDVQACADELAKWVWEHRHELDVETLDAPQAWDRALEELAKPGPGYVVINEASDNPGGGTPGDGTGMLAEMLKRNEPGTIFGYIYDKEFVEKCFEAGVGGKVSGLLGGKTDHMHGDPVMINDAEVLNLSNGKGIYVSPNKVGQVVDYKKMARIRAGNTEVIVAERCANQTFDDRPFLLTGADINQYRIVLLKSATHFKGYFNDHAKAIVTANTPGLTTANYTQLPFKKLSRPIYPLDPDTEFNI
ncbi:MAG: M81 family metallopeptidase [Firmicutes bacterium]|nr:M81 family metallopeptidase [Bacillota bacterium]